MIVFRHADPRFAFLWEGVSQPPARWHREGEGPAQYFADTPDGAWAEFLRHEEIKDLEELVNVRRAVWAVDLPVEPEQEPDLPRSVLLGGRESYAACQAEASRLRAKGATRLVATSAALLPGGARGHRVEGGLKPGPPKDGTVIVVFGRHPDLVGWAAMAEGRPRDDLLQKVRHF